MHRLLRAAATCAVAASLVSVVALAATSSPAAAATQNSGTGLSSNFDWAALALRDGGWPTSNNNLLVMTQWMRAENPTSDWWNRDNPLNNGDGSGGGSGLGSYPDLELAAYYVAHQLEHPDYGYPLIVSDLAASAPPTTTAAAIWASSWASRHYGDGSRWGTTPVDTTAAPLPAWSTQASCTATYPANTYGPCGPHFSTSGGSWRDASPQGLRGRELWTYANGATSKDTATWSPKLSAGEYNVEAYLPALYDSAHVTYTVRDASGSHPVHVDQAPYVNTWVSLGGFKATSSVSISVTLGDASADREGSTDVGADAMSFVPSSCVYPANVLGPVCSKGFSTIGDSWRSGAPRGLVGKELWTSSDGATPDDSATWAPSIGPGTYDVEAYLPAANNTAHVTYVVKDAKGAHDVPIDQGSYDNAWADLGTFTAATASGISVTLGDASSDTTGTTDVAADAMSFSLVSAPMTIPGAPTAVTAAAGATSATVSWLAPSKIGGTPVTKYTATASPGGKTCSDVVAAPPSSTCTFTDLSNGTGYTFTVRATNAVGTGVASASSLPVLPQQPTTVLVTTKATTTTYGQALVLTATVTPPASTGTMLFSDDYNLIAGCQAVPIKMGRATCTTKSAAAGSQFVIAMYSGDTVRSGSGSNAVTVTVKKATTHVVASTSPASAPVGQAVTLQAAGLPVTATGTTLFTWGSTQLCAAKVRNGAASCATSKTLKAGTYRFVAKYGGDTNLIGSSSVATFTIT